MPGLQSRGQFPREGSFPRSAVLVQITNPPRPEKRRQRLMCQRHYSSQVSRYPSWWGQLLRWWGIKGNTVQTKFSPWLSFQNKAPWHTCGKWQHSILGSHLLLSTMRQQVSKAWWWQTSNDSLATPWDRSPLLLGFVTCSYIPILAQSLHCYMDKRAWSVEQSLKWEAINLGTPFPYDLHQKWHERPINLRPQIKLIW